MESCPFLPGRARSRAGPIGLLLICVMFFACAFVTGCASSQPIDERLGDQNLTNAKQAAADLTIQADLLDRAKADKPGDKWRDEWTPNVRASIEKNAKGLLTTAVELRNNAYEKNGGKVPPDNTPPPENPNR